MAEQDQSVTDPEESVEPEKKGKMGLILGLVVALLLPAAGAGFLVYSRYEQVAEAADAISRIFSSEPAGPQAAEPEPLEYGVFSELDALTVNPAGSNGRNFLQVKLGLEAQEEATFEELTSKEPVVRDAVLKILSSYSVEQLGRLEARDSLRTEIRSSINGILDEGEIQRLYFTQYVLQ